VSDLAATIARAKDESDERGRMRARYSNAAALLPQRNASCKLFPTASGDEVAILLEPLDGG